ncbi:MAG: hypothetical protein WCW33_01475 [Candidatus Babeliales bacterium]|jgi:hypothetical protein
MKSKQGSALLIVMVMSLLLTMLVLHAWFVAGLYHDLACQRAICHHNFSQAEAIFDADLVFIQHHFDALYKKTLGADNVLVYDMSKLLHYWFPSAAQRSIVLSLRCARDAKRQDPALLCGIQLCERGILICSLRCMLTKVSCTTAQIEEKRFVVSHWTFGVDV